MSIALLQNMSEVSSAMASSLSDRSNMLPSAAGKKAPPFPKSSIEINLNNHFKSRIYTTSSPIAGTVTITTKRDVRFDSIQVLLMGHTKTRVDGVSSPHEVTHTFLKMIMPISEACYPVPRVLETGATYNIPFNFVVPSQLTINACNHRMLSDQLQDHHVLLPPTMGRWDKDDMAPEMARVEYVIKARVLRQEDLGKASIRIMEAVQPIYVLPTSAEEPPLNITDQDRLYTMHKTKSMRKNLLSSKLGSLRAKASQATPAVMGADGVHLVTQPTTQVDLHFVPAAPDVLPPKITAVSGKITAHTFFSSGTIETFPNLGHWSQQFSTERRGTYATSVALPPTSLPKMRWDQHVVSAARRDSGYASDNDEPSDLASRRPRKSMSKHSRQQQRPMQPGADSSSPIYHTTTLQIPFSLPTDKKTFIPTFHSCIASRAYTLHLSLQVSVGSASTTISLAVPLQIAVEMTHPQQAESDLPSFEEAEADAHLQPRVIVVPPREYRETSILPGYA